MTIEINDPSVALNLAAQELLQLPWGDHHDKVQGFVKNISHYLSQQIPIPADFWSMRIVPNSPTMEIHAKAFQTFKNAVENFIKNRPFLRQAVLLQRRGPAEIQLALYRACQSNSSISVDLWLSLGAKVDEVHPPYGPFTPIDWALAHGNLAIAKKLAEYFGHSYEDLIEDKFLAHVYGVGGFSDPRPIKTNYEGFNRLLASQKLCSLGCAFLDQNKTIPLSSSERETFKSALRAAPENMTKDPAHLVQEIKAGKPVVLYTGWHAHINVVIFYLDLVLKCDRGAGTTAFGVEIFQMTKKTELLSVIKDLQEKAKNEEGVKLFTQEINVRLGLQRVEHIQQKIQPVGNCGWASSKAAFFGLAYLVIRQNKLSPLFDAISVYKTWSQDVRPRALIEYLNKVHHKDEKLLSLVQKKIEERNRRRGII